MSEDSSIVLGLNLRSLLENSDLLQSVTSSSRTNGTSTGNKNEGEKEIEDPWGMVEAQAAFLGPSLWDNSDFKPRVSPTDLTKKLMEYMDLDEFLSENGIPLEETSANPSPPTSPSTSTPAPKANETNLNRSRTSATTNKAASSVELLNAELLSSESSSSSSSCRSMLNSVPPAVVSVSRGASAPAAKRKGRPPAIRQPLHDDDEDEDEDEDDSDDEEPVPRKTTRRGDDLALATLPGESFDPRARCFSEEELRPQPMVKKSKKQYVPDDLKDDKYWSRRQKNNIAAKRSRDARRMKENQIIMRASFLEKENTTLKAQLEKSKKENAALRQRLQKYERV